MLTLHWSLLVTAVASPLLLAIAIVYLIKALRASNDLEDIHVSRDGFEYRIVDL